MVVRRQLSDVALSFIMESADQIWITRLGSRHLCQGVISLVHKGIFKGGKEIEMGATE